YIRILLTEEDQEPVTELEESVVEAIREGDLLSSEPDEEEEDERETFGGRLADRVAILGGSWTFIILFGVVIVFWMLFNTALYSEGAFDPFPFIFLNLVLSCLAAIQAPVIM